MSDRLLAAKRQLREALAERRRRVPPDRAARAGEAVRAILASWERFLRAPRVALYAALPDELPSRPCFEEVVASGRPALLPRIEPDGRLGFRVVSRWDELRVGRYGVLTPTRDAEPAALTAEDLVLVPGVGFDRQGMRLGRGGGYYDRTFAARSGAPLLCGLAYAFQLVAAVPHDSRDQPMDAIVTDRELHEVEDGS
ncbi:MAG: 5-formyltetrahydrofolate cyclo-ligase [Myxococcota bacterium]